MSIWILIMVLTGIPLIILAYLGLFFYLEERQSKKLKEYYEKQWDKENKDV